MTEAEFRRQFDTNVLGLLLATQAAVAQFPPGGGSVINISSLTSPGVVATEGTQATGLLGGEFEKLAIAQTPLGPDRPNR